VTFLYLPFSPSDIVIVTFLYLPFSPSYIVIVTQLYNIWWTEW
jgi:hypothetical protein